MVIKVGINGFGRAGRVVFRTCLQHSDLEISAINDPAAEVDYICYLVRFDSTHGKFKGKVTYSGNEIKVNDKPIKVFHHKTPTLIPWHTAGVQYVVEASGMFTSLEKASGHLASDSVRRVIVTAPSVDVPMVIMGVNHNKIYAEQKVISCGSSTLCCLAPIAKVLQDRFGVEDGFVTSIHAMTPSLKPLDGLCLRGKHWRDHRSIHQNIIPATTGACKALGKVLPALRDKLAGLALRVPIVNVSVLDLTVRLSKQTTLQEIIKFVDYESNTSMKNIIKTSKDEAVSSDFAGDSFSCILDANSSLELKPNYFKLICWYENEYSYACRVVDLIHFSEKQINSADAQCKTAYVRSKHQDRVQQTDCYIGDLVKERMDSVLVPKVICSTHQNIGFKTKLPYRSKYMNKPILQHSGMNVPLPNNRFRKNNMELFKVWKDDSEVKKPIIRENRNSFQSCITFGPKNTEIDCMKAQDRLEKVKEEFSKMVNITEDLLRKSYNSDLQINSVNKPKGDFSEPNTYTADKHYQKALESCKNIQNRSAINDVSGDGKKTVSTDDSRTINENYSNLSYEKDTSEYSKTTSTISEVRKSCKNDNGIMKNNTISKTISDNLTPAENCNNKTQSRVTERSSINNLKEQVTRTINSIMDGLSKNFQFQPFANIKMKFNDEKSSGVSTSILNSDNCNEDLRGSKKVSMCNTSTIHKLSDIDEKFKQNSKYKVNKIRNKVSKNMAPIKVIDKSDNVILPNPLHIQNYNVKATDNNLINVKDVKMTKYITNGSTNCELISKALKEVNIPLNTYKIDRGDVKSQIDVKDFEINCSLNTNLAYEDNIPKGDELNNIENNFFDEKQLSENESFDFCKDCILKNDTFEIENIAPETRGEKSKRQLEECNINSKTALAQADENNIIIQYDHIQTNCERLELLDSEEYGWNTRNTNVQSSSEALGVIKKANSNSNVIIADDNPSVCSSPQYTNVTRYKQDIYDKLDSVSATDSETSFQMDGRKSQIINITDLTNSLEDIERLDKICRIIEISDELSDKLFSSLDNSVGRTICKKWSFKALCDKINLDEFCNKVFGTTSV